MSTVEFQEHDRVRLRPGSENWEHYVGYRDVVGEIEFVTTSANEGVTRAALSFANRQRLRAVPLFDLERA